MRHRINTLFYCIHKNFVINGTRKYAGHSKWQNIKHTKQEQDAARSKVFKSIISKMMIAVKEVGEIDPRKNSRLANLIDEAKKANMPASTLNSFLERIKNPEEGARTHIVPVRIPSGCTFILHIASNNYPAVRINLRTIYKKFNAKNIDSALSMFDCASYIIATKDCNYDQAMEDAIEVEAEDVEELKDNDKTYYKFRSEFLFSDKTKTRLMSLGYSIISIEDTCIPNCVVELSDEEIENVNKFKNKLSEIKEIKKIEDNLA
ncbi:translational activator of cytochrome c oxidase 1 [Osmia lignaria lignaria]|uniref:translational activator of cytochrome c oxidase 1 n=1 Tax=Osmia lignaria lignaria TaxID=1437193 RepID=UPI0014780DF3|nr:translational activator of cytochrome c oxidase 1 [Osmia lignaria]